MTKAERSRNLRWKKPALASLSWREITIKLEDIMEQCSNIHWAYDDDETLINALDGDEEEAFEFKMLFASLESEANQLWYQLMDIEDLDGDIEQSFNDMSVALIGNRFKQIGYDDYEEDYFHLCLYDSELAYKESGKRVMRLTKAEMLSHIGHTLGVILSFQNVELKYEYLKSTIDLLMDRNTSVIKQIKEIEAAYTAANENGFHDWDDSTKQLERLINDLPDTVWVQ